ncbi:antitoxin Xre-like helix-turn-helix domain-containing protein [Pseudoduganella rivuli]|nr:antitoxin Xre-like helix-turn-helix domain-containing protein [Pseudoduganella rivuli]
MTSRSQIAKPAGKRPTPRAAANPAAIPASKKSDTDVVVLRGIRKQPMRAKVAKFTAWYTMDITEKIGALRSGVPAQLVGELSLAMDMPKEALMDSLGLSRATINRKVQREQPLSREESERVMGMQSLIGQVQAMIDADSAPEFDAAKWLARWLAEPLPALGGATPASYMDTVEGQKYVGNLLAMAQSGAYA